MIKKVFLFLIVSFSFYSCSSSVEETRNEEVNNEEEENYVFDEIPVTEGKDENFEEEFYLIQIGAFNTKKRADNFAEESKISLKEDISVSYEPDLNLFVVRLNKKFNTKKDAEYVRDNLRETDDFRDAWIVISNK